jgi:DNA-binding response OmpR family regulator
MGSPFEAVAIEDEEESLDRARVPGEHSLATRTGPPRRRVMIVDDDRDIRVLLRVLLEQEGFAVAEAQSGLRLLSQLHVDRPDVILLDVMMSWISGFELCRSIKANPAFHDIPICFVTARSDSGSRLAGLACGASDYFVKPLDLDELLRRVKALATGEPVRAAKG